jgi:pimeloyl-ACP methyl ester carboxylesterase
VIAGGLRLSYAEQGDSDLAVLLLPGPTDSWRSYRPVLDRMPQSIRTLALSQRGHGDSDRPASGYRVEDFARDVIAVLDALDIPRAILAGHSGSCLVARRVAIDHPARVAGLVLEASPVALARDPALRRFVGTVVAGLEDPIDPVFARSFVGDTSSAGVAAAMVDELVPELLKVPARVWREVFVGLLEYDDRDELARIAAPALLIWGDADEVVGRAMQEELVGRLVNATLLVYPGIGHTPRWEEPSRFASDVAAFVDRVRADAGPARERGSPRDDC